MTTASTIASDLRLFRTHVEHAAGHGHLYNEFATTFKSLEQFRTNGGTLEKGLAQEVLSTVDLLLLESSVGRRPWTGNWEDYFAKCFENAHKLLKEFVEFATFRASYPRGYCNRFLEAFAHMERLDREYEQSYPDWSRHFSRLASLAAEMFCLVADEGASVERRFLDHPDDAVFTWLMTGYAKSASPEALAILNQYLEDDEPWVRRLVRELLDKRATVH